MMRSTVCGASWVWSVAKTRWPVSAAVSAVRDRLHVAHLADEDHVGVLAQRGLQAGGEGGGVLADLALVDEAALVLVQELDRVLDGEDVIVAGLVDLVDQRGERGRLAGAGRAGHEHDPARLLGELADDRRQAELLDRHRLGRDQAEGGAERAALEEGVDAEAADAGDAVGEVELPVGLERLALRGAQDRVDDLARVGRRHVRHALERDERAADANRGRCARRDVEVGCLVLNDLEQDVREIEVHATLVIGSGADGLKWGDPRPSRSDDRGGCAPYLVPATRAISAIDVRPRRTFSRPSSRRRIMPSCTAACMIVSAGSRETASERIASLTHMTS